MTHTDAPAPAAAQARSQRRLRSFTQDGYEKGRGLLWQACWFACQNLVFAAWWCPRRLRPVLLRWFGASIGSRVFIRHRVRVLWPWKLSIGDDTWIGEGAWLLNLEPISIAHDVCISQEALLCTGSHDARSPSFGYRNAPISVAAGAWIAARATVLPGVRVDTDEVVPAGSVLSPRGRSTSVEA